MRASFLPKLLISPSAFLVLVCVYGYIMFTVYLSFTTSTMMPSYELAGPASYERLLGLENWQVSLVNLATFSALYIVIAGVLGLAFAILIDQKIRAESVFRSIFLYPMALSLIVTGIIVLGLGLYSPLQVHAACPQTGVPPCLPFGSQMIAGCDVGRSLRQQWKPLCVQQLVPAVQLRTDELPWQFGLSVR